MKQVLLSIGLLLVLTACYKDKGNYDYVEIKPPVLSNFDSTYVAYAGDSLIISPVVTLPDGRTDVTCTWKILIPEEARSADYEGPALRIVYGLGASRYSALFTVMDNATGMKYFYNFVIIGKTAFTSGTIVLSEDDGVGKLSFIKPDGSVQPDIYEGINHESLGTGPLQVVPVQNLYYMNVITAYWVVCAGGTHPAIEVDANNMQRLKYINENFYDAPTVIKPNYFQNLVNGTTTAIINNQMYIGSAETAPCDNYYLGFDAVKRNFIRFTGGSYFGTDYVQVDSVFNPKDLKMDLIKMAKFSENDMYAFCDSAGKILELKFALDFSNGNTKFQTIYKKEFPAANLLTADTRWQTSPIGVFFFTSGDKIYRYNPLNREVKALTSDFGGKAVTMIKVIEDGNKMIAGTEGSIYTLDISTGKYGDILKKTDGIPGKIIDIVVR
jgi:hypothetical protein